MPRYSTRLKWNFNYQLYPNPSPSPRHFDNKKVKEKLENIEQSCKANNIFKNDQLPK